MTRIPSLLPLGLTLAVFGSAIAPVSGHASTDSTSESAESASVIEVINFAMTDDRADIDVDVDGVGYLVVLTDEGYTADLYQDDIFIAGWTIGDNESTGTTADETLYSVDEASVDLQAFVDAIGPVAGQLLDPNWHEQVLDLEAPNRWWQVVVLAALYVASCADYTPEVTSGTSSSSSLTMNSDGTWSYTVNSGSSTTTEGYWSWDCDFPLETGDGSDEDASDFSDADDVLQHDDLSLEVDVSPPSHGACTVDVELVVQGAWDDTALETDLYDLYTSDQSDGTVDTDSVLNSDYDFVDVAGGLHHYTVSFSVSEDTSGTVFVGYEADADGDVWVEDSANWTCVCTPLVGDVNGDGQVGMSDLLSFYGAFGSTTSTYDFDQDGRVGSSDLMALLANYGLSATC